MKHKILLAIILFGLTTGLYAQTITIRRVTPEEARQRDLNRHNLMVAEAKYQRSLIRLKLAKEEEDLAVNCLPLYDNWSYEYEPNKATIYKISPKYAWRLKGRKSESQIDRDRKAGKLDGHPMLISDLPYKQRLSIWKRVDIARKKDPKAKELIDKKWPAESIKKPAKVD